MKILVLAGGADQIALLNELRKYGHQTILIDYFENPPAKQYAAKHIKASTLDMIEVEKIALSENVDLICTACTDQALLTVAAVSEKLNLPCYIGYQTALNVTNKSYMKRKLVANGIPTSKFVVCEDVDMSQIQDFTYPLVVKPVDCNSSKGVRKVETVEELSQSLQNAINISRTHTAIVEEFKQGTEISADFYIQNKTAVYLSATSSFKIKNRKSFTILCSNYPALTPRQQKIVSDIATKIANAFHLDNCPLLIQLIVDGDDINVIEFSARMGGGSKYKLIQILSQVDIMSVYVDRLLGGRPLVHPSPSTKLARMVYVYCKPGIFDHVEGLEELHQQHIVDEYFIYKTPGMEIKSSETSGDRPAGYLITAETVEELNEKQKEADMKMSVISNEGIDIMLHNLVL